MRERIDSDALGAVAAVTGKINGIDHVGVIVAEIDLAARHFESTYGFTRTADWTEPNGRFRLVYLEAGRTTLQLVQPLTEGPLAEHLTTRGEGLHHICLAVDDLDDAIQSLQQPIDGAPYAGGRGSRVCFLAERRHGVLIELTEPVAPTAD